MGATVHPSSLTSRGSAAVLRACASSSSVRINPACVAMPTAAVAEKPKQPGSFQEGNPPAKRARGACGKAEPDAAAKIKRCPRPSSSSSSSDEDRCPADSPRNGVEALSRVTKNQASASPIPLLPEVAAATSKPPSCSMRELLERARLAKARSDAPAAADAEAVRRRDIERRRAEARREIELVVQTVEFNDPFIDPLDVLK